MGWPNLKVELYIDLSDQTLDSAVYVVLRYRLDIKLSDGNACFRPELEHHALQRPSDIL